MLMGTLDGGESELETTASPPPLILPEEKHAKQRRIEELKQGIANDPIDLYDEEFEKRVEDEILMIGNISLEMVQVYIFGYLCCGSMFSFWNSLKKLNFSLYVSNNVQ